MSLIKNKFPFYRQLDDMDCGPTCLKMILEFFEKKIEVAKLRELCSLNNQGVTIAGLSEGAESLGLRSLPVKVSYDQLEQKATFPCIAHWEDEHFVVIYKIQKNKVIIGDPSFGLKKISREEFVASWTNQQESFNIKGYLLLVEPAEDFSKTNE